MTNLVMFVTPATVLLLLLLIGFVGNGCGQAFTAGPSKTYDDTVKGMSGLVSYWRLAEAVGAPMAADGQGGNPGNYATIPGPANYNAADKSAAVPAPNLQLTLGAARLTSNGGGTSVDFEGGYVEVPFHAALNPPAFSIAVGVSPNWAPDPQHPAFRAVIESGEAEGFTDGFVLRSNTLDAWEAGVGNGAPGGVFVTGPHVTARGATNFLVVTYDGGTNTLTLYVDSSEQPNSTVVLPPYKPATTSDLRIGSGSAKRTGAPPPKTLFPFQGRIASVAVFNRALATTDVDTLGAAFLTS